jgi:hypothetical protein
MLKRAVRAALRITSKWLAAEKPAVTNNYGIPPFGYSELNRLLPKIAGQNRGIDRPDYTWGVIARHELGQSARTQTGIVH